MMMKRFIHSSLKLVGLKLVKDNEGRFDLELYKTTKDCQTTPRFINIGSGNFFHPCWFNVDKTNDFYRIDQRNNSFIEHDLASNIPLPFENNSIEIFYCSHVVEHLPQASINHLFQEFHRCLKPNGLLRVTCPDMELQYNAYMRNDTLFWPSPSPWGSNFITNEFKLVEHFATLLVHNQSKDQFSYQLTQEEVASLAEQTTMDLFFDKIIQKLPADSNSRFPEGHCNWFSENKLLDIFRNHHFNPARASRYGQSSDPRLRNTDLFDKTCPWLSLYVEGRKEVGS